MNSHDHPSGPLSPAPITLDVIRADAQKRLARLTTSKCTTAKQFREEPDEQIACLLDPILQQTGLAGLAGSSDTGKSSFLRQLAAAVCVGEQEFMGFAIHARHHSVVYVSTEDSREATRVIVNRQTTRYSGDEVEGLRFIFDFENLIPTLYDELMTQPADMVIIDCFADIYGGDLKDTQKIRAFLAPFQKLAEDKQLLVLFLHHTGKRTENLTPSKNNLLGGQGFEAKMRVVFELRADLMRPHHRHLCIVKGNYLPSAYKKESYGLHFDEKTFLFTNTQERTAFELLAKGYDVDDSKLKWEQAKELKAQGKSLADIADAMGYNSRTSVLNLFAKGKKQGWDKTPDVTDDGEDLEE